VIFGQTENALTNRAVSGRTIPQLSKRLKNFPCAADDIRAMFSFTGCVRYLSRGDQLS